MVISFDIENNVKFGMPSIIIIFSNKSKLDKDVFYEKKALSSLLI